MKPVADFAQRAAEELDRMARREPNMAMAVAAGALVVLKVVPLRWIVRGVTTMARPALIGLGLCKALELCRTATSTSTSNSSLHSDEPAPKRPRH